MDVSELVIWMVRRNCQFTVQTQEGTPTILMQMDTGFPGFFQRAEVRVASHVFGEEGSLPFLTDAVKELMQQTEEAEKEQNDAQNDHFLRR